MRRYPRWIIVGLFILTLGLLGVHVAGASWATVDATTIALIGLLLVIPLIGNVRKLKLFDFEAEIDPEEVRRVKGELGAELPAITDQLAPALDFMTIVQQDPVLGLAKLRIDLETALGDLAKRRGIDTDKRGRGLTAVVSSLQEAQVLDSRLAAGIRDILPLTNRAVHGDRIRSEDAIELARLGARVLNELRLIPGP